MKFKLSRHVHEGIERSGIPLKIVDSVLHNVPVEESDEEKPDVILDFDKDGNVAGMEILDASRRMENPRTVEYAVAG